MRHPNTTTTPRPHSRLLLLFSSLLLIFAAPLLCPGAQAAVPTPRSADTNTNPFTPRASLLRYWSTHVANSVPIPSFLLSKASPLSAVDAAAFSKLASRGSLSSHLPSFCTAAGLLCFPDLRAARDNSRRGDASFSGYVDEQNFTNYGTGRVGGNDAFKNYSEGLLAVPIDNFRRYARNSVGRDVGFTGYAKVTNVVDQRFSTYGSGATGGKGVFNSYNEEVNVVGLNFNNYGSGGNGRTHDFGTYSTDANVGDQLFSSYGKNGKGEANEFKKYATDSNVVGSTFRNYGEGGNGAVDNFTSYGFNSNVPENNFNNYGDRGIGAVDEFSSYRNQSNVGDDSFTSYAKKSTSAKVNFANYGKSFNEGTDKFTGYGQGAKEEATVGFTIYGVNNTFKGYAKGSKITFAEYTNATGDAAKNSLIGDGRKVTNRWIEPGKFFRESALKEGTLVPMPDIRDKMPRRSFLPRTIISKLPFATAKMAEMKEIFHADDNSSLARIMADALGECERAPSAGETKRCVGSVEDMLDFATSVLGRNIVVRTTENVEGSGREVMIGRVKGINGGKVTESVSCHQSLYPYLLYYCHSVPKVRVYEAEILDPETKARINHGVAICHVDTSAWGASHGAFLALGSGPGRIEVCHWIFQNDMTWTVPN
ncbi:hypothetical protein MLD38_013514 [Melastoma candidum]|uniref:Uncharacterized protein n=1 Tax=Melastoma candidum TaxID=119954 RepID=A0ACB9RAY2_9MYRT|nr:hypothetical protein MLD38_013514 [Melastoma candidum]